jgi:hypothetical protein
LIPTDAFLGGASSFYVRHIPGYQWYEMRVQSNRNFALEHLLDGLLHVSKVAP